MAQSLSKILTHIIFSTKGRYPFLVPDVRPGLHAYAATVLKSCGIAPALTINAVEDHIHILCTLSKKWAVADLIEEVKKATSKWIKTKGGMLRKFYWQNGNGAFSVSQSQVPSVKKYIAEQARHHRRITFEDEFRQFLKRHELEYDERYVWD